VDPRSSKIIATVLLLVLAAAANDLAAMRASMRAHACCAKTRHACAGVKSPDDCCKRMGHTAAPAPATTRSSDGIDAPAIVSIADHDTIAATTHPFAAVSIDSFKHPHDPPHLHTFSLLI
jgi:hypothetical protein